MKKNSLSDRAGLSGERDTDLLFLESSIMAYMKKNKRKGIDIMNWINMLSFWEEKIDQNRFAELLKNLSASGLISPSGDRNDVLGSTYSATDKGINWLEDNIPFLKRRNNALLTVLKVHAHHGLIDIKSELQKKRVQWRKIRKRKLQRKEELKDRGFDKKDIKKDKIYRQLMKEQEKLSKQLKHVEKRFHRTIAKTNSNGE
jgi:hypothetical protein